jgi:hypothetical protein
MKTRFALLAAACLLSSCASQQATSSSYVRTDGLRGDPNQQQAVLAQCKGEGAVAVADAVYAAGPVPWIAGMATRSSKEAAVTDACMARNGYIVAQ